MDVPLSVAEGQPGNDAAMKRPPPVNRQAAHEDSWQTFVRILALNQLKFFAGLCSNVTAHEIRAGRAQAVVFDIVVTALLLAVIIVLRQFCHTANMRTFCRTMALVHGLFVVFVAYHIGAILYTLPEAIRCYDLAETCRWDFYVEGFCLLVATVLEICGPFCLYGVYRSRKHLKEEETNAAEAQESRV